MSFTPALKGGVVGDFFVDMAFSIIFSVVKQVVKNPEKKRSLARAMIKLRRALELAYPPDQDAGLLGA